MSLAVRSTTFRDLELRKLRSSHVEQWVKVMSTRLAASTIKTRFLSVRSVFRAAIRDRLIATDPTVGVRLPRERQRVAAMRIPTPEQVGAILAAADDRFRVYVAVCAFAGLRRGEASALQVGDVDFLKRRISVCRQVQRADGRAVEIRLPKYGSERDVYVPDESLQMLSQLIASGIRGPWLFSGASDDPPHESSIELRWRKACRDAGVSGVTLHDLRHYFASGLIASGCDVVTVQRALGHRKASTTYDTYSHLWPTAEDRTRAGAAAMMAEVFEGSADSLRTREE
jgi:integrase